MRRRTVDLSGRCAALARGVAGRRQSALARLRGREAGRARLQPGPRRARAAHPGHGPRSRPRATAALAATPRSDAPYHAPVARGRARLHRLPWRQPAASAASRRWRTTDPAYVAARDRAHVLPRLSGKLALPVVGQSAAQLHAAQPRGARIRPLHQPVRLSRRARSLRRLPYRDDRGGRALDHGRPARCCGAARAYNNGILPFKNYLLGEAYTREGEPARIQSPLATGRAVTAGAAGARRARRALSAADLAA